MSQYGNPGGNPLGHRKIFRAFFSLLWACTILGFQGEVQAGTTNFFSQNVEFNTMKNLGHQKYNEQVTSIITDFLSRKNPKLSPQTAHNYATYITDAGEEFGVDPFLIASIVIKESTAKWRARSSRGAYGLMQIHWKAHKKAIRKAFGSIRTLEDLMKPQNNIRVGTYLFANHIRKDDNTDRALDRYLGTSKTSYKKSVLRFYTAMSSRYLYKKRGM